ncbi:MAG TPA: efflux transporter outer membrane subunit [Pirellulales bacterium]|nr:efflux transporter outer membrane subunit [Pirellulales bacterium]
MKSFVRTLSTKYQQNAVALAIAGGILLVLPGCLPALRPPLPAQSVPQNFFLPQNFQGATGSENSSQIPIDEFFKDPKLTSLVDQALVGNQQLKILAEDIQIANNEILRRKGTYLPFVSLGAGASFRKLSDYTLEGSDTYSNFLLDQPFTTFPNPLGNFLLPVADVSWQIDIWRQLRNARDAQALRFLGTTDGRNYVVTRLAAEIAQNYYGLMALDKRLENLDSVIALQEQSLEIAKARKEAAQDTELAVQRFQAEVRKNQSEKLIVRQQIIETENRINFLAGRFPQGVERNSAAFFDLLLPMLRVGVPAQLLQNRPDIRQAERELDAAGLDVRVARANFFPKLVLTAGVGYEAFNTKYLFLTPQALLYNVAGGLVAPLVNRLAIKADYMNANARQLQALYDYQRVILNAFTEVVNRVSKVQNYSNSIALKRQQLRALEISVDVANNLFQLAQVEYIDVLFAQRDLLEGRRVLIDTKQEQLSAIVNAYQALGGGWQAGARGPASPAVGAPPPPPKVEVLPPPPAAEAMPPPPKADAPLPPPN